MCGLGVHARMSVHGWVHPYVWVLFCVCVTECMHAIHYLEKSTLNLSSFVIILVFVLPLLVSLHLIQSCNFEQNSH